MAERAVPHLGSTIAHWRRRAGLYLNRSRRSVWFHGDGIDDFEAVEGVIRRLRCQVRADRFVYTSPRAETCEWLRRKYPNDNALPVPFDLATLFRRFFTQLNPRLLLWIRRAPGLSPRGLERIRDHGIAIAEIAGPVGESVEGSAALDGGVLEEALAGFPRSPLDDPTAPRRMALIAESRLGRLLTAFRDRGPLPDWTSLRERLGRPRSVLCLGNGPTSEDPRLAGVDYDCLLRVNWRWRSRGLHADPDMVFVGDLRTTREIRSCVFGFRNVAWEREILLRHLLFDRRFDRLEYFTLERVPSFLNEVRWPAHPTNGAVMIATAAALAPEKLTIAGIDLYRDPKGRYPWDGFADNQMPQMHDAELEVEVIGRALDGFRGELTILSEPLRRALEQRRLVPSRGRELG